MLRGKTIEEIVNRWSTELETHTRDFNNFAGEIAVWDRALIENANDVIDPRLFVLLDIDGTPGSSIPCINT